VVKQQARISDESYAARRARLQAQLGEGVAILPGASEGRQRFRQDPDLRYLTGFEEPDAVAVLSAQRFLLFVRPRDRQQEIWTGRRTGTEGAVERYGADEAFPIAELEERLPGLLENVVRVWYRYGGDRRRDELLQSALAAVRLRERTGARAPSEFVDPYPLVHESRLYKDDEELAVMRHGAEITCEAHRAAARACGPGRFEYEVEAELFREFRARGGAGPAYPSIVGGGENATVLHYVTNESELRGGELCLVDAGVEYEGYASDVTRTYPVGGSFEGAAREVYEAVLRAQQLAIQKARPGVTLDEIHAVATRSLVESLIDLGALDGDPDERIADESYRSFYMHRTSHFLGMDVHDVGAYHVEGKPRPLQAGMCFTVEPGLYFSAENGATPEHLRGIGVRIEDDLATTEDGHEVLTASIPTKVDEVEAWMRE
jgi:Xaa-Pro aminopeptidase